MSYHFLVSQFLDLLYATAVNLCGCVEINIKNLVLKRAFIEVFSN